MATPTYTPIASITLGSSASSVTFSSIPQDYRDLVLVFSGSTVGDNLSDLDFRANNDSSTSYSTVAMFGNGSSFFSFNFTQSRGAIGRVNNKSIMVAHFMDYSATDKNKTVLSNAGGPDSDVRAVAVRYASNNAITSITIGSLASLKTLETGATLALYGIEA